MLYLPAYLLGNKNQFIPLLGTVLHENLISSTEKDRIADGFHTVQPVHPNLKLQTLYIYLIFPAC